MRLFSTSDAQSASVAAEDQQFHISFGLIISARLADVEKIRDAIERLGGKIVFETVSNGSLYILREYQVQRALKSDLAQLREIYERKRRVEKKIE